MTKRFRKPQMRGLPLHLDTDDREDFLLQFPIEGQVTAVFAKDDVQNLTGGKYTTYQVNLFYRNQFTAIPNSQMRYMGQSSNGSNTEENPLLVGQRVVVGFLGGDPDQPFIMGTLPDALLDNDASQTAAQHPQFYRQTNGLKQTIDKNGKGFIDLVAGQQVEIRDSGGTVLLVVKEDGSIQLGGTTGLDKLLQKAFGSQLATDFAAAAAAVLATSPDVANAFSDLSIDTGLNTNNNSTTQTEAK